MDTRLVPVVERWIRAALAANAAATSAQGEAPERRQATVATISQAEELVARLRDDVAGLSLQESRTERFPALLERLDAIDDVVFALHRCVADERVRLELRDATAALNRALEAYAGAPTERLENSKRG